MEIKQTITPSVHGEAGCYDLTWPFLIGDANRYTQLASRNSVPPHYFKCRAVKGAVACLMTCRREISAISETPGLSAHWSAFGDASHRSRSRPRRRAITSCSHESWGALVSLVVRGNFAAFPWLGENVNLTALIRRDFDRILQFAGFGDFGYSYNDWGMVPKLAVTWQAISGGLLRGMRYSDDLLVLCRKV